MSLSELQQRIASLVFSLAEAEGLAGDPRPPAQRRPHRRRAPVRSRVRQDVGHRPRHGETTQVDVGFDPAAHASITIPMGSVRALDDLAGDKLLALFGRAAPRDFVDVHALREHFTRRTLESLAGAKDLGFNLAVLRDAFGVLDDLPRSAFEVDDATFALLRAEFQSWCEEIGTPDGLGL
jgi:hypothetical protein